MRSIDLLLFEYSLPFFAVIGADDGLLVFIFFLSLSFLSVRRVAPSVVSLCAPPHLKEKKSAVKRLVHTIPILLFFLFFLLFFLPFSFFTLDYYWTLFWSLLPPLNDDDDDDDVRM